MNRFLVCVAVGFICLVAGAAEEAHAQVWMKTYGGTGDEWGNSVRQTYDSGYIVVGSTESFGAGDADIWLIKTDPSGDTVWTKTYGAVEYDGGGCIQQTVDSGYMAVGSTRSFGAGGTDIWLLKIDPSGDTLWTKTYGGVESDGASSVQQTADSGYIVVGSTRSFGAGGTDIWLLKTDRLGDTLWTKTYGGTEGDAAFSVHETLDSGYVIVGWTESFGAGSFDL